MNNIYRDFTIRNWQERDRAAAASVIEQVLQEYGLPWEPTGADRDVLEVETAYLSAGGEFWVSNGKDRLWERLPITRLLAARRR
nr:hypothetical protein [Pleurocapsa sp. PCC 7327]